MGHSFPDSWFKRSSGLATLDVGLFEELNSINLFIEGIKIRDLWFQLAMFVWYIEITEL